MTGVANNATDGHHRCRNHQFMGRAELGTDLPCIVCRRFSRKTPWSEVFQMFPPIDSSRDVEDQEMLCRLPVCGSCVRCLATMTLREVARFMGDYINYLRWRRKNIGPFTDSAAEWYGEQIKLHLRGLHTLLESAKPKSKAKPAADDQPSPPTVVPSQRPDLERLLAGIDECLGANAHTS